MFKRQTLLRYGIRLEKVYAGGKTLNKYKKVGQSIFCNTLFIDIKTEYIYCL